MFSDESFLIFPVFFFRLVFIHFITLILQLIWYSDWLLAGRLRGWSSSLGGVKNVHFPMSSRTALWPTQPIQWVPGTLSSGVKRPGRQADHLQLVPRSRKRGSIYPLPYLPSWRSAYLVKYRNNITFTLLYDMRLLTGGLSPASCCPSPLGPNRIYKPTGRKVRKTKKAFERGF
jgi:hypothetical protein